MKFGSRASCSDASGVSRPSASAANWSMVLPAWMSAPSVRFARMPLSQQPLPRECGPLLASSASPAAFASPLTIVKWSR